MAPSFLANWLAWQADEFCKLHVEFCLYSDAIIVGQIEDGFGPYQFFNPRRERLGVVEPSLYLRMTLHHWVTFPTTEAETEKSNVKLFTGSGYAGDVAALMSLALGCRIVAGGAIREFDSRDPHGRPRAEECPPPAFTLPPQGRRMLPWTAGERRLDGLPLLQASPSLPPKKAVTLVRAARSYRNALWIAETDPEMAWLLFVAALETGAGAHAVSAPPLAVLRTLHGDLADKLDGLHPDAATAVAEHFDGKWDVTKKLLGFVKEFAPPPPEHRPPPNNTRFDPWTPESIQEAVGVVYKTRSSTVHAGIPFPPAMCEPPILTKTAPLETDLFRFISTQNASWHRKDVPFKLHICEYVTRGVLLGWWRSLLGLPPLSWPVAKPDEPSGS